MVKWIKKCPSSMEFNGDNIMMIGKGHFTDFFFVFLHEKIEKNLKSQKCIPNQNVFLLIFLLHFFVRLLS